VVVGSRKNLPQIFVEDVDEKGSLRYRRDGSTGSRSSPGSTEVSGMDTSTPESYRNALNVTYTVRKKTPSYGTPGSYCPASYTDAYVPPLSLAKGKHHFTAPGGSSLGMDTPLERSTPQDKLDHGVEVDSGYHGADSGYQGLIHSGRTDRSSGQKSSYEPFSNPDGSYVNTSIWETISSPVVDLRKKWRSRPSFVDERSSGPWFRAQPQQILGGLVIIVMIASLGFAVLTYQRHLKHRQATDVNEKYKSIHYGTVKRKERLEEEGRVMNEIRDEMGNELGGKRAAIQYHHDLKEKERGGIPVVEQDEVEIEIEEDNSFEEKAMKDDQAPIKTIMELAEEIRQLTDMLEQKVENPNNRPFEDYYDEVIRDELDEKQKQKQEVLQKVKQFGHFASSKVAPPKSVEPLDLNVVVEKDFDIEVESTKDKNLGEILDEAREIAARENIAIAVPKKKVTKNKNPLKVVADKGNKVSKASKTKQNTSGKDVKAAVATEVDPGKDLNNAQGEKAAVLERQERTVNSEFRLKDDGNDGTRFRKHEKDTGFRKVNSPEEEGRDD